MSLNQAILRLMLLEGEDYQEILDTIKKKRALGSSNEHLIKFLKSKIVKCSKDITKTNELERFINDVGG